MRSSIKTIAFAVAAVLIISGCSADVPAETSTVTEEVTSYESSATDAVVTAATTDVVTAETAMTAEVTDEPEMLAEEKPFEVQELEIVHVEPAPDVGSETNIYLIANEKAYSMLVRGPEVLHSDHFLNWADNREGLKDAFADYTDGIRLITEKVRELPAVTTTYDGLFGTGPDDGSERGLEWYLLGDEWLIELDKDDYMNLYRYDEKCTGLRSITELLRQEYERFPHLTVVAVTESTSSDGNELSLAIIDTSGEETETVREYLTENGADISLCSFNELWEKQEEIPVYSLTDYNKHHIALTSGVYLQASVPRMDENETLRCIRVQCGDALADEAEERGLAALVGERENIGIYGYLSLFDIVPVREPFGERAVMLDDNVLLCASGSREYTLYTYDNDASEFRRNVTALRRYHEIHDVRFDFCIEALEFGYDEGITVIAPQEQWENIRRFAETTGKNIGINADLLDYSEKLTKDHIDGVHRR